MSREIKFRTWSKLYGQWCGGANYIDGVWLGWVCRYGKDIMTQDIILEQYTGITDKNGKEIYEGDIVKARWYRAKHAKLDTKGEVKFVDGWFYIYDDPDGQDRLGVPVHNCYNIEVIGNIHENPELLKGK